MKIHLKTLGCRLNEAELARWSQDFVRSGHQITQSLPQADVVVLNTCAVTHEASAKSRRLMNRLYRENPTAQLVVSGCYASLQAEEVANNLGVDLVVPNSEKDQLPKKVMDAFSLPVMPQILTEPGESGLFGRGRHRAFIKIQDGCRYRCTFCIVTVARGAERSRSIADIITEINAFHESGVQEVVLTGVHVGGYGSDLGSSLYQLVSTILAETDMPRIRFASVEPWDLPDEFFALFTNPRLLPHMHLPLQSGSDTVLRRMARRCKTQAFAQLVQQARQAMPHFNVTTDMIVGFPGETEAEWQETLDFVEQIGFGHIHIFSYSPREGTKAARLPEPVDGKTKKWRSQQLHELARSLKSEWLKQQVGHFTNVLWEQENQENGQQVYSGYADNYCKVELILPLIPDPLPSRVNTITGVQITGYAGEQGVLIGSLQV